MDAKLLKKLDTLLRGLVVKQVLIPRPNELLLIMEDGTRFFINVVDGKLEYSVT